MKEGETDPTAKIIPTQKYWSLKAQVQNKELTSYKKKIRQALGQESEHTLANPLEELVKTQESQESSSIQNLKDKKPIKEKPDILSKIICAISLAEQLNPWVLTSPYLQALGYDRISIRCERAHKLGQQLKVKGVTFVNPENINRQIVNSNQQTNSIAQTGGMNAQYDPYSLQRVNFLSDNGTYIKIENVTNEARNLLNQEQSQDKELSQETQMPSKRSLYRQSQMNSLGQSDNANHCRRKNTKRDAGPITVRQYQVQYEEQENDNSPWQEDENVKYPKRASKMLEQEEQCQGQGKYNSFTFQDKNHLKNGNKEISKKQNSYLNMGTPAKYMVGEDVNTRKTGQLPLIDSQQGIKSLKKPNSSYHKQKQTDFNPRRSPRINRKLMFEESPIRQPQTPPQNKATKSLKSHAYNQFLLSPRKSPRLNRYATEVEKRKQTPEKVSLQIQTSPIRIEDKDKKCLPKKDRGFRRPRGRPFGWRKRGPNAPQYFMPPPQGPLHPKKDKIKQDEDSEGRKQKSRHRLSYVLPYDLLEQDESRSRRLIKESQQQKNRVEKQLPQTNLSKDNIFEEDDQNSANFMRNFDSNDKNQSQQRPDTQKSADNQPAPQKVLQSQSKDVPQQQRKEVQSSSSIDNLIERIMTRAKQGK